MTDDAYEARVRSQIEQYADTLNMHDLPDIFHVWSDGYIRPGLESVFNTPSIDQAYALAFIEATSREGSSGRILSIGCGDGSVEIRVAKDLIQRGVERFHFVCADLSPILLNNLKKSVEREGLSKYFTAAETDLNRMQIDGMFDMIMANHSLHHIEALESLFEFSSKSLTDGGIFATCDMIGRNGHLRWPETAAVLSALWPVLTIEQRYHAQLRRVSENFLDHDCSTEGFEGIRAQDILPLMLEKFHPYKFFAYGGFVDVLVDRGYGHGYDPKSESDVAFIRFLANINEIMLDSGVIKPTMLMAYFTKDRRTEKYYRDRSAAFCLRKPDASVAWTRFYPEPERT